MAAAATARVSLLLVLAVLSALVGPSHSLTCASQKLPNSRVYSNCSDLPHLGAHLHYTYDPSNSSLSVAFTAAPAPGGAWVSWAINPTKTGMVGAQALIAMKLSDGSVVAKTYNISSYRSVVESKLSFDVWDLTADASNGTMTIFATVKLPEKAASVNQVWQVGGAVNGTQPSIHPLQTENKESMSKLELAASGQNGSAATPAPAPSRSAAVPMFRPSGLSLISAVTLWIASVTLS